MREEERREVRWRGETGAAGKARGRGDKRRKGKNGPEERRGSEGQCRTEEGGKPRGARIKKAPNARSFFAFVFGLFRPVVST